MRDDFPAKTKDILAKRVGMLCSNPKCRKVTSGPRLDPTRAISIGVAAHISAAAPGGPRYNPALAVAARSAADNGLWLCQNCAKLIDSDAARYPVRLLRQWKRQAEQEALRRIERGVREPAGGGLAPPPRKQPSCYVLMPFSPAFDTVYEAIRRGAGAAGYDCDRADKRKDPGLITQGIILDILTADVVVADISSHNPNVLYELGIAHTLGKRTIILSQELQSGTRLPFDITHMLTVGYQRPATPADKHARALAGKLASLLAAKRTHDNPVSIALRADQLSLANYHGHDFLSGFANTLRESERAKVAWVVSTKLFWEQLDSTFHRRIFEQRILKGMRQQRVLLPDNDETRHRKAMFERTTLGKNRRLKDHLCILLVQEPRLFAFLPTEISIYDPHTPDVRAILLEPMAAEGADAKNDARIAQALEQDSPRELLLGNLREKTFDILLAPEVAERLAFAFQAAWNEECDRQKCAAWRIK